MIAAPTHFLPSPRADRATARLLLIVASCLPVVRSQAVGAEPRTWTLSDAHTNSILGLAFSPNGRTLASCGRDGTTKLWDVTTGRVRETLRAHPLGWVNAVAFSPAGESLATGSGGYSIDSQGHLGPDNTGDIKLWDARTGRERLRIEEPSGEVEALAFSDDGRRLASSGGDGAVRVRESATGRLLSTTDLPSGPSRTAFAPDLKTVAVVGEDHTILLIDAATGEQRAALEGHRNTIWSLAFSPDSKLLASGAGEPSQRFGGGPDEGFPSEVKLWDLTGETPRERASLTGLTLEIRAVAFSPDSRLVAAGGFGEQVRVWDAGTGALVAELDASCGMISALAFAPDGSSLAAGGLYQSVSVWDTGTWGERTRLVGRIAYCLAYVPDGGTLAAGLSDGTIGLWEVATGRVRATLQGHTQRVRSLAVSPDGKRLAAGGGDGVVTLWDPQTGRRRGTLAHGHSGEVTSLAFSPDGGTVASGGKDATVRLWDAASARQLASLAGHESEVASVAFAPDGGTLVSAGHDGTIRLWDVASRRVRTVIRGRTFRVNKSREQTTVIGGETVTVRVAVPGETEDRAVPISSLALSPGGRMLAVGDRAMASTGGVSLRDAGTGEERVAFKPPTGGNHPMGEDINALGFSPDGRHLAVAGYSTVWITDSATGRVLAALRTSGLSPIRDVAFSPDGKALAASGYQVVQLWDVEAALGEGAKH